MPKLHQCTIPDTPESTDVSELRCVHCDHKMEDGDIFTTRIDGYKKRGEYEPCTRTAQG